MVLQAQTLLIYTLAILMGCPSAAMAQIFAATPNREDRAAEILNAANRPALPGLAWHTLNVAEQNQVLIAEKYAAQRAVELQTLQQDLAAIVTTPAGAEPLRGRFDRRVRDRTLRRMLRAIAGDQVSPADRQRLLDQVRPLAMTTRWVKSTEWPELQPKVLRMGEVFAAMLTEAREQHAAGDIAGARESSMAAVSALMVAYIVSGMTVGKYSELFRSTKLFIGAVTFATFLATWLLYLTAENKTHAAVLATFAFLPLGKYVHLEYNKPPTFPLDGGKGFDSASAGFWLPPFMRRQVLQRDSEVAIWAFWQSASIHLTQPGLADELRRAFTKIDFIEVMETWTAGMLAKLSDIPPVAMTQMICDRMLEGP
jgi:hypothetical protein